MLEAMEMLNSVVLKTPIKTGDTVIENLFGAGVDFVACKNIEE